MNRKYFLKQTAAVAPLIVAFNPLAAAQKSFLRSLMMEETNRNRVLVLVEMIGGNDGLNTVIPIDKYNILSEPTCRRDILIPENKILKLNDTNVFGFHPSMEGLQNLYNNKLASVIHGVGHPEPEFSHFRARGMKYTANTQKEDIRSGWLGRYLEHQYPHYPKKYPLHHTDGPPAFRIGAGSPKLTQGTDENLSIGIANISDLNSSHTEFEDEPMGTSSANANIHKIRAVSKQIKLYAPIIQAYTKRQENLSKLYPEPLQNILADQLKTVARLIGSGLNTRIYIVEQHDYDTHADQVEKSDTTQGKHATLLKNLSEAITAFQDDLQLMGKQDEVLTMTFSEFGRRIASGSYGTDHGTSESVMLFGSKLKNGMIGTSPQLPSKITVEDNLPVQFDFRTVYKSVLKDWLAVPDEKVKAVITQGPDEKLDLFKL